MKKLLDNLRRKVEPDRKLREKTKKELDSFLKILNFYIQKNKINAEVFVGGSYAKDTWLSTPEIDVFVRFSPRTRDISEKLKQIIDNFSHTELRGSRTYYRVGMFEIVPILKVSDPKHAKNITDLSPLHVHYVKKNLKNPNDVRLLKLFCKSLGVYGAEDYIAGFSGYVLELLICHYGTFENLVKNAAKWEPKVYIEPMKVHKTGISSVKNLSSSKTKSPLIIIDPTFKKRNAAAGLNYRSFSKFVFASRMFAKNPKESFFRKREISRKMLERASDSRGTKIFFREFEVKGKPDIFFSKLRKTIASIKSSLESHGFLVYNCGFTDKFTYFEMKTWKTAGVKKHIGPFVWAPEEHFRKFIEKWKRVYVEDNRLVTDVKTFSNAKTLLDTLLLEHGL